MSGNHRSSANPKSKYTPYNHNRNADDRGPYTTTPNNNNSHSSSSSSSRPQFKPAPTTLQGKKFISLESDGRDSRSPNGGAGPSRSKVGVKQEHGVNGGGGRGRGMQADLGEEMALFQKGIKDESGRVLEFKSADDMCPVCKTHRLSKPNLRLLISPCYHKVCESCVDKLFSLSSQTCPEPSCSRILRKTQFHHQTFEDLVVEQEVSVRRRMGTIFNKTREDFGDVKEYNDYLEQVEDWTYNIINNVDRAETEQKIREWQNENASAIAINASRQADESALERELALEEQEDKARRAQLALAEDVETEKLIEQYKKEMLEDIARGGDGGEARKKLSSVRDGMGEIQGLMKIKEKESAAGVSRKIATMAKKHAPTSPNYSGPYIPLPWVHEADMIKTEFGGLNWAEALNGQDEAGKAKLQDPESWKVSLTMHGDSNRVKAGGFRMEEVWKRQIALAQDSLLIGL